MGVDTTDIIAAIAALLDDDKIKKIRRKDNKLLTNTKTSNHEDASQPKQDSREIWVDPLFFKPVLIRMKYLGMQREREELKKGKKLSKAA